MEAIGIDLGTTYSCVAVWKGGRIEIIANDQGNRTTPSAVAFVDAERLIGDGAKNQAAMSPANTIFDAKRLIGRRFSDSKVQDDLKLWPFKVIQGPGDAPKICVSYEGQEKEFSAQEISSMIVGKMKQTAEGYLGKAVTDAVITVPAYFNESQRQETKDAGAIAGLNVIGMINEPTAAAIAYGLDNKPDKMNVIVFDLGGGTFDVSLLAISGKGGTFEVKAVCGDTHLGGQDFDNGMVSHCVEEFKRRWNKDLTVDQRALGRLRCACEKAKRILSCASQASIEIDCLHEGIDFSMRFTRAKFEELNMVWFDKCIETVETCLRDAKMEKSCVDEVILVGGSTRIPKVQQMLQDFFNGKQLCKSLNPDEAVAYGAAVMAAKLSGDLVQSDVTPLSLGIEMTGHISDVVIQCNTPIPTKKAKVYEGERGARCCSDDHLLGKIRIYGIPPAPEGVSKVKVCFEIDARVKTQKLAITNKNRRQLIAAAAEEKKGLEKWLYKMKNRIKKDRIRRGVRPDILERAEKAIAHTSEWLRDNQDAPVDKLHFIKSYLQSACMQIH